MATERKADAEIGEFLPNTKEEKGKIDKSKAGKYKITKKTQIIVFPEVRYQKNSNNNKPMNTKNVEDLQHNR